MAFTQKELAEKFNVSQGTVSRALNGCPGVREDLRRNIIRAATSAEVARGRSAAARGPERWGRPGPETNVICVMAFDEHDDAGFNGRIIRGICAQGRELGLEVLIVTQEGEDVPLIARRRQVDGIVRVLGDLQVLGGRTACPVPWVSVLYDVPGIDAVTVSNYQGAFAVGRHVAEQGHRRVAFIGPETELARERLAGLRAAVEAAGGAVPSELVYLKRFVASEGPTLELIERIFDGRPHKDLPFTALVAYNDYMAALAMRWLGERGWRIPRDLSIAGFDGVLPAELRGPDVTTAAIPLEELGAQAVRLLLWRLRNPDVAPWRVVLDTEFRLGETVAPPAR